LRKGNKSVIFFPEIDYPPEGVSLGGIVIMIVGASVGSGEAVGVEDAVGVGILVAGGVGEAVFVGVLLG